MFIILKAGSAPDSIRKIHGDFEDWIARKMNLLPEEYLVFETEDYQKTPSHFPIKGIVITGSPLMVTDLDLQDKPLINWILEQQQKGTPILGICFGHQLLNVINGGQVGYNAEGLIIGSRQIHLSLLGQEDELLGALQIKDRVYKTHSQSLKVIPPSAHLLAVDDNGIADAVKFAPKTWGVQFHPEFTPEIMNSYLQAKASSAPNSSFSLSNLTNLMTDFPVNETILKRFKDICSKEFLY